jgi:hypothetical protein
MLGPHLSRVFVEEVTRDNVAIGRSDEFGAFFDRVHDRQTATHRFP